MKIMIRVFAGIAALSCCISANAACESPSKSGAKKESTESMLARTIFNRATAETSQMDQALKKAYGCKYIFADVLNDSIMNRAKVLAGSLPGRQLDADGMPKSGKVVIGYIITTSGVASDQVVLETSSPALTAAALESMKQWRFEPATVNGRIVASLAVQEFLF
ncbi:MAG: TonB family protein [Steroidobacteraceae bacterium]